jgi:lipopolysaccharide transport system ATP-binding protein
VNGIMQNEQSMLELNNVSLSYHSKKTTFENGIHSVLDSVSLTLTEGETLGVIGKNGCGKTTILRVMAGILTPTHGNVIQRAGASSALLSIGLGFKQQLSGRDNVVISAMLQGSSQDEALSFLDEIKEFSELGDSFEEPVKTYSAGMKSRLGFTTALMTHVDIMLIDEVLSVGDAHFKQKAEQALKDRIQGNQTVVFVSHAGAQIDALCDRAIWLNDAKIAAEGNTAEVLAEYNLHIKSIQQVKRRVT